MRLSVINDVLSSFYYRDEEGNPLYSYTSNLLLFDEIEYLEKEFGFEIEKLNPSYHFVKFNENVKKVRNETIQMAKREE